MHLSTFIADVQMTAPALLAWVRPAWSVFARGAGATVLTSLWQGGVIACGLEIALRMAGRMGAAHRFALWAAGFGIALGLPLVSTIHFGGTGAELSAGAGAGHAQALLEIDARWGMAIAALWLIAAAIRGSSLLAHSYRLRQLWKAARPVEVSQNLAIALKEVRGGRVAICTTRMLDRPSVIGFFAPRILIPEWLMNRLTEEELEQIVLHEAEHLRRGDDWTNLAQKLALVVFPLNPALAWMEHRLCREREMACDEGVVRMTKAPRTYATCLASLAEHGLDRRSEALSLGAWHKRSELAQRVHGILLGKRRMSRTAAGVLLGSLGCALIGTTVEMARCPQLVAFVPEQKSLAMTPARQQAMDAMLASENAEARMVLPPGYRATEAKVLLPPHRVDVKRAAHKQVAAPTSTPAVLGGANQVADTDVAGDRVYAGTEQQQWVVLAAWEEVRTVSQSDGTDRGSGSKDSNAHLAARGNSLQNDQDAQGRQETGSSAAAGPAVSRYTVTQLILRVVPANSNSKSSQPATGSVRGGWFVIQL